MGRKATGTVYEKDGVLWFAFLLRSKKRYAQKVPLHPEGRPATEPEARTYLAEAKRRYDLGLWDPEAPVPLAPAAAPLAPTVAEYGTRWLAGLTHASKFNDELRLRLHVADTELGRARITEVTPSMVAVWVRALRQKPSTKGGTLAPTTVRTVYGCLKCMFTAAVFEGVIAASPCVLPSGVLPAGHDKNPGARRGWRFTREEVETLISDARIPFPRRVLWALLFLGGLRAGEAFALRWKDYDPKRQPLGHLAVDRAWSSKHLIEKGTKTGAAREVPVHGTLAAILAEWRLSGWERAHRRAPKPDDYLVPSQRGQPRRVNTTRDDLVGDCKHVEVAPRRLHGMRHTFISLAIDDGARPDVIAKVTHTRPVRSAFDQYRSESWETLCGEVAKLRVTRRHELPLWRAAAGGEGGGGGGGGGDGARGDSATGSATTGAGVKGNAMKEGSSEQAPSPWWCEGDDPRTAETTAISAGSVQERARIPTDGDVTGGNSATDSATVVGPLTGEAWVYDWVERTLLAEANERGEIPDTSELEP